jgi:hypothetical protein
LLSVSGENGRDTCQHLQICTTKQVKWLAYHRSSFSALWAMGETVEYLSYEHEKTTKAFTVEAFRIGFQAKLPQFLFDLTIYPTTIRSMASDSSPKIRG